MAQAVPTAAGAESGETRVCAPGSPALIPRLATKVCALLEAAPRLFFFFLKAVPAEHWISRSGPG